MLGQVTDFPKQLRALGFVRFVCFTRRLISRGVLLSKLIDRFLQYGSLRSLRSQLVESCKNIAVFALQSIDLVARFRMHSGKFLDLA